MHQFLWPSLLPRARRAPAVSALVLAVAAFAAPAEELPPALRLASALIAQRASEAQAAGRPAVANTLRELAEAVAARQVGLGEAALLVEIAGGAPAAPLVASGSARRAAAAEPKLSQAQAVDIVEGAGLAAVAPPVAPLLTGAVLVVARGKDGKSQLVAIGLGKDKGVNVGPALPGAPRGQAPRRTGHRRRQRCDHVDRLHRARHRGGAECRDPQGR